MNYYYYPFYLDDFVSRLYQKIDIHNPDEIKEETICYELGIKLRYSKIRSYSVEDGYFKMININNQLSEHKQREVFFHELCHILRHVGNQSSGLPLAFLNLQEWDAARFTRYAAIPLHMIKYIDLSSPYVVSEVSTIFNISTKIAKNRIEQIKRNSIYTLRG